jgi:hypothetical protein
MVYFAGVFPLPPNEIVPVTYDIGGKIANYNN